jgi:hypothetical protein
MTYCRVDLCATSGVTSAVSPSMRNTLQSNDRKSLLMGSPSCTDKHNRSLVQTKEDCQQATHQLFEPASASQHAICSRNDQIRQCSAVKDGGKNRTSLTRMQTNSHTSARRTCIKQLNRNAPFFGFKRMGRINSIICSR